MSDGLNQTLARQAAASVSWPLLEAQREVPKDYWEILKANQGLFWSMAFPCLVIAALYTFGTSPVYQAKATLELQTPNTANVAQATADPGATPVPTYDAYVANQIGVLQSDRLLTKTVETLKLEERLNRVRPSGLVALRKQAGLGAKTGSVTRAQALEIARRSLVVRQARMNSMVEVLYNSVDPNISADFVNTLTASYAQLSIETRWDDAQHVEDWLTRQLNALRTKLETSEVALQNYDRKNNLLPVDGKDSFALAHLRQVQEQLSQARADRIQKQSRLERAEAGPADAIPQLQDDAGFADMQIKLSDMRRQLAEYQQIYTPNYGKAKALRAQINEIEAHMTRQAAAVLGRLREEFDASSQSEKMLSAEYDQQATLVSGENEKMIRYNTLKHEVDTDRALYESLLQKVKESGVTSALQATNIHVVDAAIPPAKPYKPVHALNLGLGALSGMLLGLTAVAIRVRNQLRLRSLPRNLAAVELGVIPSAVAAARISAPDSGLPAPTRAVLEQRSLTLLRSKPKPATSDLRCWLLPDSPYADAVRGVMTSLLLADGNRTRGRMILVTSPNPGEGKTTLASNLAVLLAQTGRRTLLIDADVRRPRIHDIFDLSGTPGLATVLDGKPAAKAELMSYVRTTAIARLSVLPSGQTSSSDYHLLHTTQFAAALSDLRTEYDMIVIDAPPVLGVPETRVLTALADGAVLVLRSGSTTLEDALATQAQIVQDGGRLLGTVLNDAPAAMTPYHSLRRLYAASAS